MGSLLADSKVGRGRRLLVVTSKNFFSAKKLKEFFAGPAAGGQLPPLPADVSLQRSVQCGRGPAASEVRQLRQTLKFAIGR
jgi:hypothetical protein